MNFGLRYNSQSVGGSRIQNERIVNKKIRCRIYASWKIVYSGDMFYEATQKILEIWHYYYFGFPGIMASNLYSFIDHFLKNKAAAAAAKVATPVTNPPRGDLAKLQASPPMATLATDDIISFTGVEKSSVLSYYLSSTSDLSWIYDFSSSFGPSSTEPFSAFRDSSGISFVLTTLS